ncbi:MULTISPECIES: 1-phosphofructokinase family hexose kinase [unclassified Oceanispirochaeta]|uniref:1-phosphofructokinase family hexose kinase n=1 Tax=unclassified Oceanispirochaeta TaxID=2635722 RepID=UPI000E08F4CB|nr:MULTISPECIES: 1-phosphofructokinase family hexose kinase [unclassified Oceanispirochaeta]MBF9017900.1 1-phosphofructokinase family hexose kinase [Oceanispirochaeta sp. M2]NPD74411.1 1-phosphofructokinase family hexose kinase [Oceanispirochaeta sp. M1]RDG29711.1 1-phosphofructokinase family hexose kinase [Oceanispirochaeta sp. M1]
MMKKKILTVTLNPAIDYTIEVNNFAIDAVNRASASRRDPGGKGINVGTALSQGGFPVCLTGFLGKSNIDIFLNHIKVNSMEDRFLHVEGPTREGIKVVDPKNAVTTDINFPGFMLTEEEIARFIDLFSKIVSDFEYIVMSGSIPAGVPSNIYGELALIAKRSGAFVAVDTSGEALRAVIESGAADLIKPNIEELAEIYQELDDAEDKDSAVGALAEKLLEKVGMIALSMGGDGSRLYSKSGIYDVSTPKITVKSTVGAGDAYLAGLVAGLASDMDETAALKSASSWAASKLTMFGPGLSKESPPFQYLDKINVFLV